MNINPKKENSLIRIIGLTLEITGVLLLSAYIYTEISSGSSPFPIYSPPQEVISSIPQSEESSNSSNMPTEKENVIPPKKNSSQQSSKSAPHENEDKTSSKLTSSKVSKPTSSKKASSKASSKPKPSSKPVTSEEESSQPPSPDTSTSKPQSEPPFESDISSKPMSDDSQTLQNQVLAEKIADKYTVSVEIATEKSGIYNSNIEEYASNSLDIKSGLNQIETSLKAFPESYFSETATDVSFLLASKTTSGNAVLDGNTIIVPCFKTIDSKAVRSFLLSISAERLIENVEVDYSPFNPEEFTYGAKYNEYIYSSTNAANGYFLSAKAQMSQQEDLHATFMAIFEKGQMLIGVSRSSPYYDKLAYTCEALIGWSECFKEIDAVSKILS